MFINGKMRPLETILRMVGRKNNGEWWNGWIQVWYILRDFANGTMYSQQNNKTF
jgi:hypothetical protein